MDLRVTQCYSVKTGKVSTIVHRMSSSESESSSSAGASFSSSELDMEVREINRARNNHQDGNMLINHRRGMRMRQV